MTSALLGLGVGLSLIVAIGAQNAFVLRSGIAGQHVGAVVSVCIVSDAVLIAAGVAGVGVVVSRFPSAVTVVTILGAGFLAVYGLTALRRARHPGAMTIGGATAVTRACAIGTCLALTWLNPHVYLDTVVFVGSVANHESGAGRWWFALGAMGASAIWFTALGYGARLLRPVFTRPSAWRVLDIAIGVLMLTLAATLVARLL
ncbi:LysE/ArgO family amino acid transporter [Williamsia sp. CHRR-6]|uniref:LysE/ArgO family amino acid transporter n=1 Tax=Williamsia sp. CHRR-6 TaxID=2835871 RepID=UPI001BD9D640|nr:LysE/ArgO family amino acid transporter [Williamsia sp. CHRR-6]MBT0565893.1 amino acid transporter [Williamsia sp. CHRR-6]